MSNTHRSWMDLQREDNPPIIERDDELNIRLEDMSALLQEIAYKTNKLEKVPLNHRNCVRI